MAARTPKSDGWSGPTKLGATPTAISGFRSVSYRPRAVYELDYDGDGRTDVAFAEHERFLVYRATEDGFETEPLDLRLPVEFASDDFTISFGIGGGKRDQDRVTLYDVGDYNGDGIGDLVTNTLIIGGLLDYSTRYDFYFGTRADGETTFPETPDTSIESSGVQSPFEAADFNNDGRKDLGLASINIGIGKIIAALLTGSVRFDVDFYLMGEHGYPEEPNVSKPIKIRFSLRTGTVTYGRWMVPGDVTGDGLTDLLVPVGGTEVEVYAGTGDANLFADQPTRIIVDFPDTAAPGGVEISDLNADGRDDMVIRFPAIEEGESNRVGVALSR